MTSAATLDHEPQIHITGAADMNPEHFQFNPEIQEPRWDHFMAETSSFHSMPERILLNARLKESCDSCSAAKVRCSSKSANGTLHDASLAQSL